jgi:hypothetical protein
MLYDRTTQVSDDELLREVRDRLQQESGDIQKKGQALSSDEQALVEGLNQAGELIDEAIRTLAELPGKDKKKKPWLRIKQNRQ